MGHIAAQSVYYVCPAADSRCCAMLTPLNVNRAITFLFVLVAVDAVHEPAPQTVPVRSGEDFVQVGTYTKVFSTIFDNDGVLIRPPSLHTFVHVCEVCTT